MRDLKVFQLVIGHQLPEEDVEKGYLFGYKTMKVEGEDFPALVESETGFVEGILVHNINEDDFKKITFYEEGLFGTEVLPIQTASGDVESLVYAVNSPKLKILNEEWDFDEYQNAVDDHYLDQVKDLMKKNVNEKVEWATGQNIEHATKLGKKDQQNSEYTIMWLNIDDLFYVTDRTQKLDVRDPSGGKNTIGDRIEKAKDFWAAGGYMDLPIIGWSEYSEKFYFTNGRHRLVAAYQLGDHWAPVLVDKDSVKMVKELIRTKWLSESVEQSREKFEIS